MITIGYVLNNSVSAKMAKTFADYPWSSGSFYFNKEKCETVDCRYIEKLFGTKDELQRFVLETDFDELPTVQSDLGQIIGGEEFIPLAMAMAERRSGKESVERRRGQDKYFEPLEKVIQEFEKKHQIKIAGLNVQSYSGKKMRAELLVHLKERAGMTYREIAQLDLFADLELSSLGCIYRRAHLNRPG